MAKGARASTKKANNARLKSGVFGPVETARTERLSQKLLELAQQPKPKADVNMEADAPNVEDNSNIAEVSKSSDGMDIDSKPTVSKKARVEKRRTTRSKASIVFPKYKTGKKTAAPRRKRT